MLETGNFQTKYWHNEELCWLIKFLKLKKYSVDKIYEQWRTFRLKDKPTFDEDMLNLNFKSFCKTSKNVVFEDLPKIYVYQEEIDYINSLPAPLWVRQYVYFLLLHVKIEHAEYYDSLPYLDYFRFLSITDKHERVRDGLLKKLRALEIITNVEIKEHYNAFPICDNLGFVIGYENNVDVINIRLKINLDIQCCSDPIGVYDTILDAIQEVYRINSDYKCPSCGKIYSFNKFTKRDICENCYKQKRRTNKTNAMRKLRNK